MSNPWYYISANENTNPDSPPVFEGNEVFDPTNTAYRLQPIHKLNDVYISGVDAKLYIECHGKQPELVAEGKFFQHKIDEPRMPIYGYASKCFDSVAHGTRLVQGAFTVNMKGVNYLENIVREEITEYSLLQQLPYEDALVLEQVSQSDGSIIPEEVEANCQKFWGDYSNETKNNIDTQEVKEVELSHISFFKDTPFTLIPTYKLNKLGNSLHSIVLNNISSIDQVYLTSLFVMVDVSGRPVEMAYQFIAADYNRRSRALRMYK